MADAPWPEGEGGLSGIELVSGDRYPHGTRARYVGSKCRCDACRAANTAYRKTREGADYNGLVDASPARAHLLALSATGVGKRAVAAASDVALSVLGKVRTGKLLRVRANTAKRILAVDAAAASDHACIPAKETRAALRELLRLGLTKTEIATRLGSEAKVPALQINGAHVTAVNAMKVERLLTEVRAEFALEASIEAVCSNCSDSHTPARRLAWLATVEADKENIIEARPCWYGGGIGSAGERALYRDLATLRERRSA